MAAIYMCGGAQHALSPLPCCHNHRGISPSRSSENDAARWPKSKRWLGASSFAYSCGVEPEMGVTIRTVISVGAGDSRSLGWLCFFALEHWRTLVASDEWEGLHGAPSSIASSMDHCDVFDCARGKLISGIVAPRLQSSSRCVTLAATSPPASLDSRAGPAENMAYRLLRSEVTRCETPSRRRALPRYTVVLMHSLRPLESSTSSWEIFAFGPAGADLSMP